MGLFGKLFEKKECSVCGGEIGLLGNRKLEDGNLCKSCAAKLSPWFSDRRQSTVAEIQEQLAYREANQEKVAAFRVTRTLGEHTKVLLDEDAGLFMVTPVRNWEDANPDVLSFSDVTGCKLDIDERKTEIEYRDNEGQRQSFNPKRYAYSYDFYIVINVNHPYFSEIRFQLNSSAVDNDEETLLDGPDAMRRPRGGMHGGFGGMRGGSLTSNAEEVRASVEYRQYEEMGREIRRQCGEGRVYAVEKDGEALNLIEANGRKFHGDWPGFCIVEGEAPEALEELEPPTHAFIGGSAGRFREIVDWLVRANPQVRIAATAITLETAGEILACMRDYGFKEARMVQVSVAEAQPVVGIHMLRGNNPVFLAVMQGADSGLEDIEWQDL